MDLSTSARAPRALRFVRTCAGARHRHRHGMTPGALARQLVQLQLDEAEALAGARISHGAIRDKFAALARQRRDRRRRLLRQAGPASEELAETLSSMVARALTDLCEQDPLGGTPRERLATLTAGPPVG